jgi:hypothetical protein
MNVNVNIDTNVFELLNINQLDLETELSICAAYYFYYASAASDADLQHNEADLELETYEADLARRIKDEFEEKYKGVKPAKKEITEAEVKREYRKDIRWQQLKKTELKLQNDCKKMNIIAKAFEMKNISCTAINKRDLYKANKGMVDIT